mmetsp:Transcript_60041/g.178009  ORF Transcript_60041/g.178009 Transcript_60041/m.178009 type:complete len:354 (+) Transcript_60041:218-1279(+)
MTNNTLLHDALGSATASIISRSLTHPLDTAKARLQAPVTSTPASTRPYSGTFDVIRRTIRREGVRGLYRGFPAVVVGGTPGTMAYLCGYEFFKGRMSTYLGVKGAAGENKNGESFGAFRGFLVHFASGMLAETIVCIIYVPVDVVKERLQVQHQMPAGGAAPNGILQYSGSFDALQKILRTEGLSGIYKGYAATLASFGPFSALYFVFYERSKAWTQGFITSKEKEQDTAEATLGEKELHFPHLMACSAGSGALASFLTSPLDMAKLRLQVQRGQRAAAATAVSGSIQPVVDTTSYRGMIDCLKRAYCEAGLRGLFRGAGARVLHFTPSTCIMMTCFEKCRSFYATALGADCK